MNIVKRMRINKRVKMKKRNKKKIMTPNKKMKKMELWIKKKRVFQITKVKKKTTKYDELIYLFFIINYFYN